MAQDGSALEFEDLGMVVLIGALLIPGVLWITQGPSTGAVVRRSMVVAGIIAAAVAVERAIDQAAGSLVDTVEGNTN